MFENKIDEEVLSKALWKVTGTRLEVTEIFLLSGGFYHQSAKVTTRQGEFFIKWSEQPERIPGLASEAESLHFLQKLDTISVPKLIGFAEQEGSGFLVTEYLQSKPITTSFWQNLGQTLVQLHAVKSEQCGFEYDTYYLSQRQDNHLDSDWGTFYFERRLKPQFGLAYYRGHLAKADLRKLDSLQLKLEGFFPKEPPTLLHGNFWSGNCMALGTERTACLYNPSLYFGHREMDLAHALLLGSPQPPFWEAYQNHFPVQPDFKERLPILQLYPLMVHVNVQGTSYLSAVQQTLKKFI